MADRIIKNVAVIGCGIGRLHIAEGYAAHPDKFRVLAICDLDPARLASIGDEFGIPLRFTDYAEVLAHPDIDIVDICTPPGLHVPQSIAALDAGKQVICEKPLAGSLADVDRLIAADAAAKTKVMPIFQYRWGEGFDKARAIVAAGLAGKPYVATVETHWLRGDDYFAVPWRGKWATELGVTLMTHAIHIHDLLCGLMGPVTSVYARLATRVNPIEVEDCVAASLEMETGALASISCTLGSVKQISRMRLCFENVTFESGTEPYSPGDDPWTIMPANDAIAAEIDALLAARVPVQRRFAGQLGAYHAALLSGAPLPVTLQDARRSIELATALYTSGQTGAPVALPIGPDHSRYHGWAPR
jgi:predicted dehydrogenase